MRSAASLPEISTGGTPTPGAVYMPAKWSPGTRRAMPAGLNQAVWVNRWSMAKGVPPVLISGKLAAERILETSR